MSRPKSLPSRKFSPEEERMAQYFYLDALGSIRMVTTSGGSASFANGYQPYGRDNGTPLNSSPEKFTGKTWSGSINLYYYGMRWYDPSTGRFISPGPKQGKLSNPQSLNLYIYVIDRPTSLTDPSGMDWWNPWSWTPQQQAQAFTVLVVAVAVVAVVATVVTFGATAPLAAAAIGAAVGAASSTTIYTVTAGDKATLGGAALSALTGAVAGAIGGGVGGIAVKSGLSLGLGMLASGVASAGGNQIGKIISSRVTGQDYQFNPIEFGKDFGIGAVTFGIGNKLGVNGDAQEMATNRVYGGISHYFGDMDMTGYESTPFVSSVIQSTATLITVGQAGYNVGTQVLGNLFDAFT